MSKGSKSVLAKRLGALTISPTDPDTVTVDVEQIFYRIVWPHGDSPSYLITATQGRMRNYPDTSKKIIVFNKYQDGSAKAHERLR